MYNIRTMLINNFDNSRMMTVREGIRGLERFRSTIAHIGMFGEGGDIYGLRNRNRPTIVTTSQSVFTAIVVASIASDVKRSFEVDCDYRGLCLPLVYTYKFNIFEY